jgi:glycosyltransferase involved in cell wall biosynthesis
MSHSTARIDLSVIIPVGARQASARELFLEYREALGQQSRSYEFIFVLDGNHPTFSRGLAELSAEGHSFSVVQLSRPFGEATAIMAGFERSSGAIVLTLPAYHQIKAEGIARLLAALDSCDLAIGRRWPRAGGLLERVRRKLFHGLLASVTGLEFNDLGCGARAFRRLLLEEVRIYGDQQRFLALLADRQGFVSREVDIEQSPKDRFEGSYGLREYARAFLDLFSVFFLVRFTKKPLRFFGMWGVLTFAIGATTALILIIQRLFFDQPLADRPALLVASLMIVLGLQLFALGLLGELIIFTHARDLKDYKIAKVVSFPPASEASPGEQAS